MPSSLFEFFLSSSENVQLFVLFFSVQLRPFGLFGKNCLLDCFWQLGYFDILKKSMFQYSMIVVEILRSCRPFPRRITQHLLHQINGFSTGLRDQLR